MMVKYPKLIFKTPRNFTDKNIDSFLYEIQDIFLKSYHKDQLIILELNKTTTIDICAILVLYKFMEYTAIHKLFYSPFVNIDGSYIQNKLYQYGFNDLFKFIINNFDNKSNKEYRNLKTKTEEDFIIAPKPLLRHSEDAKKDIEEKYYKKIESYYNFDRRVVTMIFTCISEAIINFMAHATSDSRSILVAMGNKSSIKIACVDNGDGIITTMRRCEKYKNIKLSSKIMHLALQKHITSKDGTPYHMGCGLWIIDEIVTKSRGHLYIYSEGVKYSNISGKKKFEECAKWKGTIISIGLLFENTVTPEDIMRIDNDIFM